MNKYIISFIFILALSLNMAYSQEIAAPILSPEDSLVQDYNSLFQLAQTYDKAKEKCFNKSNESRTITIEGSLQTKMVNDKQDCLWDLSNNPTIKELTKRIGNYNDQHRNFYLSAKDEDSEFIYYYGHCQKEEKGLKKTFSGLLHLPVPLLKTFCDPRIVSYQDLKMGLVPQEKELAMAQMLCLKFYEEKYKDCANKNLTDYIEEKQQVKKHIGFVRIPNIMVKIVKVKKYKKVPY